MIECFRCGYCGQPTNKDGVVLTLEEINALNATEEDWNTAEQTHGECCVHQENAHHYYRVTKEMAMDAGDPDLEGQLF